MKITRYCSTCKHTTKHEYDPATSAAKCLSKSHGPFKVRVCYGDVDSILEALDAVEAEASAERLAFPRKTTITVHGSFADARNVLGQFGYDEVEEV